MENKKLFDVTGSLEPFGPGGGDGAYGIIGRGHTIEQILENIKEQLLTLDESLWSPAEGYVRCYLTLSIGPAGTYDDLPI